MEKDLSLAKKLVRENFQTKNPYLDLGYCGITNLGDLPELFECTHLETLILSNEWYDLSKGEIIQSKNKSGYGNDIEFITKDITKLKKIKTIKIGGNHHWLGYGAFFTKDLHYLHALKDIVSLDLSYNLDVDDYFIRAIKNSQLRELYLDFCLLVDSINSISEYAQLNILSINNINISDISFLQNLTELQSLDISNNKISNISFLQNLTKLQSLDISNNDISDINALKDLTQLQTLNINDISISNIPKFIFLRKDWKSLVANILITNNILNPPPEKISQGTEAILEWFKAIKKRLNEIKIIIVGDAKAGKTTLLKYLKDGYFDDKIEQTDGINIEEIVFDKAKVFKNHSSIKGLKGLFWDFGGQEIMSATHKIFLSDSTTYILLYEARKNGIPEKTIKDKIKEISSIAGNSPIIIVSNKIDNTSSFDFTNKYELKKEFSQIKGFINISCKNGIGIDILTKKLAEIIPNEGFLNKEIDIRDIKLKNYIIEEIKKRDDNNYFGRETFDRLCIKADIPKKLRTTSIDFLHKLGIVLHFNNIFSPEYFVIDPNWITTGIYRIITSKRASEKYNGVIDISKDLPYILNEEKIKHKTYTPFSNKSFNYNRNDDIQFIANVLVEFNLGFFIDNKEKLVIPDIVKANPEDDRLKKIFEDYNLAMSYYFEYLNTSIINQIIIKAQNLDLIDYWRNGFAAKSNKSKVLLNSEDNKIIIKILGKDAVENRNFIAVVQDIVDNVIKNYIDKNKIEKQIPIPDTNKFVSIKTLKELQKGIAPYYIIYEPEIRKILVSELLDGVDYVTPIQKELLDKQEVMLEEIEKGKREIIQSIDVNRQEIIDELARYTKDQQNNVIKELSEFIIKAFEANTELRNEVIDEKLKEFNKIKNDFEVKAKLAIPLLKELTGGAISIESEFDIKQWSNKMYKKYELQIFKFFGYVQ